MNLPTWVGYGVFFLLPIFLWLLVVAVAKRKGVKARALAVIAGSDNRLSLSRLQAFAWTLIIFGSFAAAMAIHTRIIAANPKDLKDAEAVVKTATENADKLRPNVATTATAAKAENDLYNAAQSALREAETKEAGLNADATASPESKQQAHQVVVDARVNLKAKADNKASADKTAAEAKTASEKADQDLKIAVARAKSYEWVEIPAALLALAGIAIGSGVFSSLISAVNAEDKTACVTSLGALPQANLKEHAPDTHPTTNPNVLSIRGKDFGTSGAVRLDNERLPILLWKNDGTEIIVDVKDGASYENLTVDTANGKLSYVLTGKMPGLTLGLPKIDYEFSDLFRDDKDPSGFSLMKFQMFGWTFIAIVIYVYLFLADLRPDLESLPVVPASLVILTGLSQGGYLSGKAVSGMEKPGGN